MRSSDLLVLCARSVTVQKTSNTTVLRKQHERPIAEIKEVKKLREREKVVLSDMRERERESVCVFV